MERIHVSYYKGAYGNTLMIQADDVNHLIMFKTLFGRLSSDEIQYYNFNQIENIALYDIENVLISNNSTYVYTKKKAGTIYWEQTPRDWFNCEGLMDGLIENNGIKGGHQYFTGESDGIVVVI